MIGVPDGLSRIDAVATIDGGFVALWQGDTAESAHLLWSPDGRSWFVIEGGPVGRIGEPQAIVVGISCGSISIRATRSTGSSGRESLASSGPL